MLNLSLFQLSRLRSLVDNAIDLNNEHIEQHKKYLLSLSEDKISNLDEIELNYSKFLEEDNDFLLELKQALK